MARYIAQRELRDQNAKVIRAVIAGETFVVTGNGEPVAELRPIRAGRRFFVSRDEVAALAVNGAEKILGRSIDSGVQHDRSVDQAF